MVFPTDAHARLLSTVSIESHSSVKPISFRRLGLSLLCPILVTIISRKLRLNIERKILIACLRTILQLLLTGYVLLGFIFTINNPFLVFTYLLCMGLIASLEVVSRQVFTYDMHFRDSLLAVVMGGGLIGAYGSIVVFHPSPWWDPKVMVPTAGMIIGNSVSGPSLAVDRLLSEITEKRHEAETRLAFGATALEACAPTVQSAILAALVPTLNQMSVVGLVSIPGMMTGQLLGGASPLVASEYQMAILWLLCGCSAISTTVAVYCAIKHAAFDDHHRLTTNIIVKKKQGKISIEVAMLGIIKAIPSTFMFNIKALQSIILRSVNGNVNDIRVMGGTNCDALDKEYSQLPMTGDSSHGLVTAQVCSSSIVSQGHASGVVEDVVEIELASGDDAHTENEKDFKVQVSFKINATTDYDNVAASTTTSLTSNNDSNKSESRNAIDDFFVIKNLNIYSGTHLLFENGIGLNLTLRRGERVSIEGPSGLGKSRLLRAIARLDVCELGSYMSFGDQQGLDDLSVSETSGSEERAAKGSKVPSWRSRVIYVSQAVPPLVGSPKSLLLECCGYTSREGFPGAQRLVSSIDAELRDVTTSLGLEANKLEEPWSSLSGGQRQRAAIALGLLLSKCYGNGFDAVLLLDEPTAACDVATALLVESALAKSGITMIVVTHDERQSTNFVHRRIILV